VGSVPGVTASLIRASARAIPLADNSVDLIITSPPYFSLRSYRDGGEHFDGQLGSEPTPQQFLEALWEVSKECWRVLKPTGSMFINLGDKRAGSGGHNNAGLAGGGPVGQSSQLHAKATAAANEVRDQRAGAWSDKSTLRGNGHVGGGPKSQRMERNATRRQAPDRYNQSGDFNGHSVRRKSKMLIPHRYAIGCEDGLADPEGIGWVVRSDLVWHKPNGLPESVTDRVRDSHEYWFHLTRSERYFAGIDEIRKPYADKTWTTVRASADCASADSASQHAGHRKSAWAAEKGLSRGETMNPGGALPGSVWEIATEPLVVPEDLGVDHFAAFPQEWPRRLILGWSPSGICVECGEGRRPVVSVKQEKYRDAPSTGRPHKQDLVSVGGGFNKAGYTQTKSSATITGYSCACENSTPPTRPAVVLDPFCGTGTVPMVARALGRFGIGLDLSRDYLRLADWRVFRSGHAQKSVSRMWGERQGSLLPEGV
jgi:DNA modification methylase